MNGRGGSRLPSRTLFAGPKKANRSELGMQSELGNPTLATNEDVTGAAKTEALRSVRRMVRSSHASYCAELT